VEKKNANEKRAEPLRALFLGYGKVRLGEVGGFPGRGSTKGIEGSESAQNPEKIGPVLGSYSQEKKPGMLKVRSCPGRDDRERISVRGSRWRGNCRSTEWRREEGSLRRVPISARDHSCSTRDREVFRETRTVIFWGADPHEPHRGGEEIGRRTTAHKHIKRERFCMGGRGGGGEKFAMHFEVAD